MIHPQHQVIQNTQQHQKQRETGLLLIPFPFVFDVAKYSGLPDVGGVCINDEITISTIEPLDWQTFWDEENYCFRQGKVLVNGTEIEFSEPNNLMISSTNNKVEFDCEVLSNESAAEIDTCFQFVSQSRHIFNI